MPKFWARALAVFAVTIALSAGTGIGFVAAQTATSTDATSGAAQVDAHRQELQDQLNRLEDEITQQQTILAGQQAQSQSLERDIEILDTQIKSAKLGIQATDVAIQQLGTQITAKQDTIGQLLDKLDREKQSVAQMLRTTNELDSYTLPEIVLSSSDLSGALSDLDTFNSVESSLKDSFEQVTDTKTQTESQKADLEDQQQQAIQLKHVQQVQQQSIASDESQKAEILRESKGQEKVYQQIIADKQSSAAEIRAELFQLQGSAAIPFGTAYQDALVVQQKTGIRPAFLLGIIAEESNLGENVGTGTWTTDMNPTRDAPVFQAITSSLGLDPDKMPVSKKAWYGWGGAMGPAQFIPSTWALYAGYVKPDYHYDASQDKIGALTGHHPSNPWDPQDAFMASGMLLRDSGGVHDERTAALCYLAGCANAKKPAYAFYANDVLSLAAKYQNLINVLQQN